MQPCSPTAPKIKRLFIANRGEICRRIATTARRMGIETVAVTDRQAPPSFLLGVVSAFVQVPEESPAVYLDATKMVALAVGAGCDALHPGFGFLSENAEFATACVAAGLIWVGPKPQAIAAMASKATARAIAEEAGVPCIKGLNGFPVPMEMHGDFSILEAFADQTGYPLLLKAALGGGGKGMRLVHQKVELREAAQRAASEALNSFGDGRLICERYLGAPRHVEVQILADQHGHVCAIGDRDCSVQRRHQKIIEEAPAPDLSTTTRKAIHAAAIRLAAGVGYDNAGTVEFLVDWSASEQSQDFFFLEMNTRLQVEHPVTEEVFGLDLVEWQIRIAQGEALPSTMDHLPARGHSVEIRLYAEDVFNNYFPAPGPIAAFVPAQGPGIRWEVGIDSVDAVTGRFDPMVAKLVATGSDRSQAISRLADALERTVFAGPRSNIDLLIELTRRSAFKTGAVTTHYLTTALAQLLTQIKDRYSTLQPLAQLLSAALEHQAPDSLALVNQAEVCTTTQISEQAFAVRSPSKENLSNHSELGKRAKLTFALNGAWHAPPAGGGLGHSVSSIACGFYCEPGGKSHCFWYAATKTPAARLSWLKLADCHFAEVRSVKKSTSSNSVAAESEDLVAPVPGKLIAIKIQAGDHVDSKQALFILESMKMEFEVKAPRAGTIGKLQVKIGEQVTAGQQLATWA